MCMGRRSRISTVSSSKFNDSYTNLPFYVKMTFVKFCFNFSSVKFIAIFFTQFAPPLPYLVFNPLNNFFKTILDLYQAIICNILMNLYCIVDEVKMV